MKLKDFKPKDLEHQTIVITGASSGIGLATAEMAAKKGARVVLSSRNIEDLEQICARLQESGCKVMCVKADVKSRADLEALRVAAESAFGTIDTWVNNAGGSIYGTVLDTPEGEARELFETNFWGLTYGSEIAVGALREKGGVLINLGSEVSARSIPLQGYYSVKAFTDALRMELEHDEVPVNVCLIRPTAINTPFPDHAVNHLKSGEPSLPEPCYHPDFVAEAILKCAVSPERDRYVGAPAKMSAMMEFIAPGMTDKRLEKSGYEGQSQGTEVPHSASNEGLYAAPDHEGEMIGPNKGKTKMKGAMKKPHITDQKTPHH